MSNVHILYVGNDTVLQMENLQDDIGGTFVGRADVQATLVDDQGNEVAGAIWPLSLVYLEGSKGMYRLTLPYTLALTPNRRYVVQVVADAGPGLHAEWAMECVAKARN